MNEGFLKTRDHLSEVLSKYKISFYNHLFSREGQSFVWNTASGALIKIDAVGISFLERFQAGASGDKKVQS